MPTYLQIRDMDLVRLATPDEREASLLWYTAPEQHRLLVHTWRALQQILSFRRPPTTSKLLLYEGGNEPEALVHKGGWLAGMTLYKGQHGAPRHQRTFTEDRVLVRLVL